MRLQAIKLAGFKSFVDPTTVPLPSNLCAVVGPNGCGKSNIIDAVRWVMGESSAKNLRGESMTDVIFNGSNTRKPVGQASIELLFDNAEGRLSGEYAGYSEVSVKRQVTRDGQSSYFLNSRRCRRKDITDLFLGTGLGPRSYSIIEQGIISDLIEARPEELRGYLEEAAGISKYKERRRETERRMEHTRDNLDRLNDLREELNRQIGHLERQAKAAEKYTELKADERRLKAELQALRWQAISAEVKAKDEEIGRFQVDQDARVAEQRRLDAEMEAKRAELAELSDQLDEVQKRYYDQGTEIARIEENIQHRSERNAQFDADLKQVRADREQVLADIATDEAELTRLKEELAKLEPRQGEVVSLEQGSSARLQAAEETMQAWQAAWEAFNQKAADNRQQAEVQQSRIAHLEESIERSGTRIAVLDSDLERLSGDSANEEITPLTQMLETQQSQITRIESELAEINSRIDTQRSENNRLSGELDSSRSNLQSLKGRHSSLEALQQAALGQQDDAEVQWLEGRGLGQQQRLAEKIQVEEGWELAVETVLGSWLQAVCVEGLDAAAELLGDFTDFTKGHLDFIAQGEAEASDRDLSLAGKVTGDAGATALLKGVFVAESLAAAMNMRAGLADRESVVTKDGIWLGKAWLRVRRDPDARAGVIKRQQELVNLAGQISSLDVAVQRLNTELEQGVVALAQAESDREATQARLAEQQRTLGETSAQLGAKQTQAEQVKEDKERASREITESRNQLETDSNALGGARSQLQIAIDGMEADTQQRSEMTAQREQLGAELNAARENAKQNTDARHQLALNIQELRAKVTSVEHAMQRLKDQEQELTGRQETLEASIRESLEPEDDLKRELEAQLEKRLTVEQELSEVRTKSEQMTEAIRQREQARAQIDETIEGQRSQLEAVRLERQGLEVRRTTIAEQLQEEGQDLQAVIDTLDPEATEAIREETLTKMTARIQRLGAINLAAIDEYKVQSERKQYLDAQNEDLEKALETLQNAIRKIDVETRTRFKETFDKVDARLQQLFPKLFGGGHAYLEMTGDDLLDTGVSIMARPPGKRNTNIHLLSGGEKALTAIALVFSIFSLNPAPFCLLDEVDAPLDDANCMRYTEMVKEISRTVQLVFITHNKIAMEMGEHLIGVTMQEPGVSRLVTVDIDEAVALAAV